MLLKSLAIFDFKAHNPFYNYFKKFEDEEISTIAEILIRQGKIFKGMGISVRTAQ